MPNQGDLRTLIVTSAIPGEGKSTVASNLAITMALAGARVLLVDADLRRGDLTELFKMETKVGLSSVLRGDVQRKAALQPTMYSTLTLMPSGPVTNQSAELLLKPSFAKLLAECREEFDLTIFNTSPILATDDTATISPNFDGTLMVVRAQLPPRGSSRVPEGAVPAAGECARPHPELRGYRDAGLLLLPVSEVLRGLSGSARGEPARPSPESRCAFGLRDPLFHGR